MKVILVKRDLHAWGCAMDMPIAVTVPDLKTGEMPLRISAWFVDPGNAVEEGDRLFEVLLPGVTCDVAATCAGTLLRIEKTIDAEVRIGETVAWIERRSGFPT
jgi:pyruvate/2-oxoglutarate dehydrogenase complex dihydrolipoamide acyltransferase (E2) component